MSTWIVAPLLGRDLREPALHQRLASRDDLDDGRHGRRRDCTRSSGFSEGVFIEVSRWPKKALLGAFRRRIAAADFACPVQACRFSPVMLAARIAASRLL